MQALDFLQHLQELELKKIKHAEQQSAQKHIEKQADKSPEQGRESISKQGKSGTRKASSKRKREITQVSRKKRAQNKGTAISKQMCNCSK